MTRQGCRPGPAIGQAAGRAPLIWERDVRVGWGDKDDSEAVNMWQG